MLTFRSIWPVICLSFLWSTPLLAQGEIVLYARVNNQDVKLLFDTGAETTVLFNKTATRLKLDVTKRDPSLPLGPGKVSVDRTEECDFQLSHIQMKRRFYVYTPPEWVNYAYDGILAWATIKDHIFHFAFEQKNIETLDDLPKDIASWSRWKIGPDKPLTIQVEKNDGNLGAILLDTSSFSGVGLNTKRWQAWRHLHPTNPATLVAFSTPASGLIVREECWADRIDIENFSIKDVPVMQSSPDVELSIANFEAVLGSFALVRFDIIIDGENDFLYTKPVEQRTSQYAHNHLGAVFVPDDMSSGHLFAHVVEGSPAHMAGLRNRDILTRINDLDVTQWRTDPRVLPLSRFWGASAGTKLKLTYSREGVEHQTTVELREILNPQNDR